MESTDRSPHNMLHTTSGSTIYICLIKIKGLLQLGLTCSAAWNGQVEWLNGTGFPSALIISVTERLAMQLSLRGRPEPTEDHLAVIPYMHNISHIFKKVGMGILCSC